MNKIPQILWMRLSLGLLFLLPLFAQVKAQVKNEEVTVIAAYEPSLSDANKININPEIEERALDKPDLKYNIDPPFVQTSFTPEKIIATRVTGEPLSKLYNSYIKAGFGNYTTPYAELFYNNLRSRTSNLGFHFKHYSSLGTIKDYAPSNFSDNKLSIYGSYISGSHIVSGKVSYLRNGFHYYGFKPADFFNTDVTDSLKEATFQKYTTLEASASIKSDYSDKSKLQHSAALRFYNLTNFVNSENAIYFDAGISKRISITRKIEDEKFVLDAGVAYFNNPEFTVSENSAVYSIKPQLSFRMNQYALNVGFNTSIESADDSYIHFFPIIEGQIAIAKDVLSLYGSATGGIERNNLRSLFEQNPFYDAGIDSMMFTKNNIIFDGGLKGNIASILSFNMGAGFKESLNMPFFVNDTNGVMNTFSIIYDDVSIMKAFAHLSFQATDNFSLLISGTFNHYTMGVEDKPWHMPSLTGNVKAAYTLVDKIKISAELYAQDKTKAKVYNTVSHLYEIKDISAIVDFNLGLEYLYNKKISAFLNLNNMTGARYYKWYNYPSQRFHILAGVTYAF